MSVNRRLALIFTALIAVIVSIWMVFYSALSAHMRHSAEERMELLAQQIIDELGEELFNLERLAYSLAQIDEMQRFISLKEIDAHYAAAQEIAPTVRMSSDSVDLANSIIVYDAYANPYRFKGNPSNALCGYVYTMLQKAPVPGHLALSNGAEHYIGYTHAINGQQQTGYVTILTEESTLMSMMSPYVAENLDITIHAGGDTVLCVGALSPGDDVLQVRKNVGFTPFSITVAAGSSYINSSIGYVTAAAGLTLLALFGAVLVVTNYLRHHFFTPMLQIMQGVETLDTTKPQSGLPYGKSAPFNALIQRINTMLEDITISNENAQEARLALKNAEIEKQQAIIDTLKKQINAHFSVNTLNAIRTLIDEGEMARAKTAMDDYCILQRYAYSEQEFINAWDEFDVLQRYIDVMDIRYRHNIQADFEIDDRMLDIEIPRMLLQPLVENAIVHGFSDRNGDHRLLISAALDGDIVTIQIADNGVGIGKASDFSGDAMPVGLDNIALQNIGKRLKYYYGDKAGLSLKQRKSGGTRAVITLLKEVRMQ